MEGLHDYQAFTHHQKDLNKWSKGIYKNGIGSRVRNFYGIYCYAFYGTNEGDCCHDC